MGRPIDIFPNWEHNPFGGHLWRWELKGGKGVKFIKLSKPKDIMFTLPPAVLRQLVEGTVAWADQQKQAGKLLEIYSVPGWGKTIAIYEFGSAEEMAQSVAALPVASFLDIEFYPLADWNEFMKGNIEFTKRAEQMFPAPQR